MTVASVTIKPHEKYPNWFRMVFISRRDSIGETTIELLVSEETLRWIRYEINKTLGEKNEPQNLS